jgi:hypothetical protein
VEDDLVDSWSPSLSGFGPISAEAPILVLCVLTCGGES